MSEVFPSYGNSYIPKSDTANPTRVMMEIIEDNPKSSQAKRLKIFVDEALANPDLNRAALFAEAVNLHQNCLRLIEKNMPKKRKLIREERAVRAVEVEKTVSVAVMKTKQVWFTKIMGCTFGQVARLASSSPQLAKLSKMGRPNQVISNVLSEAAVKKILG